MKPLVVIPILNEADNIEILISDIVEKCVNCDILVVDGGSTDASAEVVKQFQSRNHHIHLMFQEPDTGFGQALKLGFKFAISHRYDPVITMDGDLSHSPEYLPQFFEKSESYDLVIGSRYINGVRVEGWKFRKLLTSKLANIYISYILVKPIWDFTSGYRCYRLKFLEYLDLDELDSVAYIIQIQLLYLAFKNRFSVKEIPFIYRENNPDISKVYQHSKRRTFFFLLKYRAPISEILRHLTYLKKDYKRYVQEYEELINPPKFKDDGKIELKDRYKVSIGVMAYNEENMIGKCLDGLLNQKLKGFCINEIVVVSSGSTDRTNSVVQSYSRRHPSVRLIEQKKRLGKASAINEYLKTAHGDILILESADTFTEPNTVHELIKPFHKKNIGMTGAHPVPVNEKKTFIGYCVHKLWNLHHNMAMDKPKCGEMIAFRNLVTKIPNYTAVDEAAIESIFRHHGYDLVYAKDAIVHNKGPENLRDFLIGRSKMDAEMYYFYSYACRAGSIFTLIWSN